MGARPVCAINSLRFGELDNSEVRRLFRGVVNGIAHYGNCFGIPTVAGEVYFDKATKATVGECLRWVCCGMIKCAWRGQGRGQPGVLCRTGHRPRWLAGAAFASQNLTEESAEQQRSAVQVGVLHGEALHGGLFGIAGDKRSGGHSGHGRGGPHMFHLPETAARGGTGIEIDLAKVPQPGRV